MNKVNEIQVVMNDVEVGRLAITTDHLCAFEYSSNWLECGFSISPFFLPLETEVYVAKRDPFNGGFGVFDDCLPDGWGNLILDRFLKRQGIDSQRLTLLQRLALVGSSGRGALEFRPDLSDHSPNDVADFDTLAEEAEKILTTEYSGGGIDTLYKYGGSPGGARPKVFVNMDDSEWMVKFKSTNDPQNIGEVEYEYALLAKKCGIDMPEVRLFEGKYFGVKRFDRSETGKVHTISGAGLLHANYREPSLDYESLLNACLQLTRNMEEVEKLFRIMVFNVAIRNMDDHAKNFSFQYVGGDWKLSPAYDLLPSAGFNGEHTTSVNGNGNPGRPDLLAVARKVGMKLDKANGIIDRVYQVSREQ
jgi:serine/threonine-protein kinase HipA